MSGTSSSKVISLRFAGHCSSCGTPTPAKTRAWWDTSTKQITCLRCHPEGQTRPAPTPAVPSTLPPPQPIDSGDGGASARREYERRRAKHEAAIEAKWGSGRVGRLAKFLSDEPSSTSAWAKGAAGERRLARRLTDDLAGTAIVLHDRRVPKTRGNIDHLAIASNGVWVIDAKNYKGMVECRDVGGWFKSDLRLYVGGRNQTKLVGGLTWQVDAVRAVLDPIGFGAVPVHPVLCFTDSDWGLFSRPIRMNGVAVIWAKELIKEIQRPGLLDNAAIDLLAHELSAKLPASR